MNKCQAPKCKNPAKFRFCRIHTSRKRARIPLTQPTVSQNFWFYVEKKKPNECWPWKLRKSATGYGTCKWNGVNVLAHRIAWMLTNKVLKKDICVLHKCDNPRCCNPNHLWLGTRLENNQDKMKKGRHVSLRGSDHPHARFTENEIIKIRRLYATTKFSHKSLGIHLNIPWQTIGHIVARRVWKHI